VQVALSQLVRYLHHALSLVSSTCITIAISVLAEAFYVYVLLPNERVAWTVLTLSVVNAMMPRGLGRFADSLRGTRKGARRCREVTDQVLRKGADKDEAGWVARLPLAQAAIACARSVATRSPMSPANPAIRSPAPSAGQG